MKRALLLTISFMLFSFVSFAFAQNDTTQVIKQKVVHAGCSKCVFHTSGKCSLAVKIGDEVYEVEGSTLKDHGKPRAKDGLCKVAREAEVSGELEDGKFIAFDFKLLPIEINQLPLLETDDSGQM